MGHPEESVSTMQAAMNLPGVKKTGKQITWKFLRHNSIKRIQSYIFFIGCPVFCVGAFGLKKNW